MRNSAIKQISSLGVVLPYDDKVSSPPKIVPIVFFANKNGTDLKTMLQFHSPVEGNMPDIDDLQSSLVFVRRNYDGSELYYYVTYLNYSEFISLQEFIKESKGGILL